ncbi:MAG: hypothetical protein J5858_01905 [Lentisphaeria bacterium]|nr:hypothetical protein [Lentisphaeria bacterium]
MPDFLRWLLNAAKPGKPLPPGEFIWSPGKHFLFHQCRRAWFFRHYLAQGGWNDLSSDPAMHAYLLKYLSTVDSWMSAALEESLSGALLDIMLFSGEGRTAQLTEAFQIRISSHLIHARDDLMHGEYLNDPKRTSFQELYYDTGEYRSIPELLSIMQNRFADFFRLWEDSGESSELAAMEPLSWRLPPEYRTFVYAGQQISLRPWIYAVHRRMVKAWTFRFSFSGEGSAENRDDMNSDLPGQVLAAWCAKKYPEFELCIRKILITPKGLICRTERPEPVDEDLIALSAYEMLETVNHPGGLKVELFPRLETPEACSRCRFRQLCETQAVPPEEAGEEKSGSQYRNE